MPKETMSPRERWLAVLEGRLPDRAPMDYWATGEATAKLVQHLGVANADEAMERLHIDLPVTVGAKYVGPPPKEGEDIWGCRSTTVDYGTGVYSETIHNPLAQFHSVAEIEASYTWPQADWWDHSGIAD